MRGGTQYHSALNAKFRRLSWIPDRTITDGDGMITGIRASLFSVQCFIVISQFQGQSLLVG